MPELELPKPGEVEEVDPAAPTVKRAVALAVVAVTFFGAIVAFLRTVAANDEDNRAREAARASVVGMGAEVDAVGAGLTQYRAYLASEQLEQAQLLDAGRARGVPAGDPRAAVYEGSSARAAEVRAVLRARTGFPVEDTSATADEAALAASAAERVVVPETHRLRAQTLATESSDYGSKADAYVAVLTLLAASLFLFGLSLTVSGRGRSVLLGVGACLSVVGVVATVWIALRPVRTVSVAAIDAAARAQAALVAGSEEEAIALATEALALAPEFPAALGIRASAVFGAGSTQTGSGFASISSPEAIERSTRDLERAIEVGGGNDVSIVGNLGFQYFLLGRYGDAARLTRKAIDLNERDPALWFNLGVVEIARGDERAARDAYTKGLAAAAERDPLTREQVVSAALVDLGILLDSVDGVEEAAQEAKGRLAAFDARDAELDGEVPEGEVDAEIEDVELGSTGRALSATYRLVGLDAGTVLDNVWYYRSDPDRPFDQPPSMRDRFVVEDPDEVVTAVVNGDCPPPGEYRLEVYAGTTLLGAESLALVPGELGELTFEDQRAQGWSLCRPADWTSSLDEEFGGVLIESPDGSTAVGVQVLPSSPEFRSSDPDRIVTALVELLLTSGGGRPVSDVVDDELTGFALDGGFVALPAKTGFGRVPGATVAVTGSLGPDKVARIFFAVGPDEERVEQLLADVRPTLQFERVATGP